VRRRVAGVFRAIAPALFLKPLDITALKQARAHTHAAIALSR
jgi:hypothetical protein